MSEAPEKRRKRYHRRRNAGLCTECDDLAINQGAFCAKHKVLSAKYKLVSLTRKRQRGA